MKGQDLRKKLVGDELRRLRVLHGLTQKDVSSALSYDTAQFVSNWERGVSLPPDESLRVLARLFKTPVGVLVNIIFRYRERALETERVDLLASFRKK